VLSGVGIAARDARCQQRSFMGICERRGARRRQSGDPMGQVRCWPGPLFRADLSWIAPRPRAPASHHFPSPQLVSQKEKGRQQFLGLTTLPKAFAG
jgi:hypothetical protein